MFADFPRGKEKIDCYVCFCDILKLEAQIYFGFAITFLELGAEKTDLMFSG